MSDELYAAVLLPRNLGFRHVKRMGIAGDPDGQSALYRDASSLPFILEELISQGVTFIAIDRNSPYFWAAKGVPDIYRHRLLKVDEDNKCTTQLHALMAPILQETGVELQGVSSAKIRGLNAEVERAVAQLALEWIHRYAHPNLGSKRDAVSRLEGFGDNLVTPCTKMQQQGSKMSPRIPLKVVARYT
jgi:hypothetical protein